MVIKIGSSNREDVKLTSGQLTRKDGEKVHLIESRFTATAADGAQEEGQFELTKVSWHCGCTQYFSCGALSNFSLYPTPLSPSDESAY